jgi:hypothetical protein
VAGLILALSLSRPLFVWLGGFFKNITRSAFLHSFTLCPISLHPFQQYTGGFVIGILGDEFTSEGFGEEGGGEPIGFGEESFPAADDFVLFIEGWKRNRKFLNLAEV